MGVTSFPIRAAAAPRIIRPCASGQLMVRTVACMSGVAAMLASFQLLAARMPASSLLPAALVALLGLALVCAGGRLPVPASPLICMPLLLLGAYTVSKTGDGDGALLAYVLPIIWVAWFFDRAQTTLVVCAVAIVDAVALTDLGPRTAPGLDWFELMISLVAVAAMTTAFVESHRRALADREAQARLDPLTGLHNRRGLDERAVIELARARREDSVVSVIAFDIDHFKRINDTHGHDFGDEVLVHFAQLLRQQARIVDVVARIGGEEFVLLLPSCGLGDARAVADRFRERFSASTIGDGVRVTVSAGVAAAQGPLELRPLLLAADRALYASKAAGRNCTQVNPTVAESERPQPRTRDPHGW